MKIECKRQIVKMLSRNDIASSARMVIWWHIQTLLLIGLSLKTNKLLIDQVLGEKRKTQQS